MNITAVKWTTVLHYSKPTDDQYSGMSALPPQTLRPNGRESFVGERGDDLGCLRTADGLIRSEECLTVVVEKNAELCSFCNRSAEIVCRWYIAEGCVGFRERESEYCEDDMEKFSSTWMTVRKRYGMTV